jgi:hypothetical protein
LRGLTSFGVPVGSASVVSKVLLTLLALVLIVFIGYVDYATGFEVSLSVFYLIPISLVVWFVDRRVGIAAAGLSAISWMMVDILGDRSLPTTFIPYWTAGMRLAFFLIVVYLLSGRKNAEAEREQLIGELTEALANVKTLRGLLPICAACKKVRDDKGYWNQIEAYLRAHSEASFSHAICPECAKRLYPDLVD